MSRLLITALLLGSAVNTAFSAQPMDGGDPLSSSECAAARDELEKALSEPPATRQPQRLARARKQAALVCLGPDTGNRERSGAPQPAQAVPAPAITLRPAPEPAPALATPQPPPTPRLDIPRAAAVTICDPAGCWDSEGRRLNNMGPLLMGPRGLCTIQGGLLNCP